MVDSQRLDSRGRNSTCHGEARVCERNRAPPARQIIAAGRVEAAGRQSRTCLGGGRRLEFCRLKSNLFEMEWPRKIGTPAGISRTAGWFEVSEAREKILKVQAVFLDRLLELAQSNIPWT